LSYHFKKNEDWDKAVSLWKDLTSLDDQLFCFKELAMYYEHRARKYEEAKKAAEQGLALAMKDSESYQKDFEHRLERINEKVRKQKKDDKAGKK
jgi:hypothetical protein